MSPHIQVTFLQGDFFKIFAFPLINGTNRVELAAPNTAVLTEALALKMFGKIDVVSNTFVLENDKTIQITGVLKNVPKRIQR